MDANNQELDTSANSALDEGTQDNAAQQADKDQSADSAQSSAAQDATDDEGLLSVVRDVVDARKEKKAQPSDEGSSPEGTKEGQETDENAPKPDDENFSDVPFHKHPRFQQLLHQAKSNKVDAERYRNVQGFLDNSGLQPDEAADGLVVMALAKTDPAAAWKQIRPWVEKLLHAAGEVLPQDLEQRVQTGEMSREAAIEVSRLRAQNQSAETRRTFEQQQAERRQQTEAANALHTAASEWEQERQARDPNFAAKMVSLQKEILFLQSQEGKPNSPQGVRDQLNRAYKAVNETPPAVAAARPAQNGQQRREIKPVMGGSGSGSTRPEPKSTLDIVRARGASA